MKNEYVIVYAQPFFPDWAGRQNKLLLVLKNKPLWQDGFLNLLGGKIEPEEDPETAAIRELKEESGYNASKITKMGVIDCEKCFIHCFLTKVDDYIQREPKPREGETEVVRWLYWEDVKNDPRLIPNLRIIIPLMINGVKDWILHEKEPYVNQTFNTVDITFPSNLHESLSVNNNVSKTLKHQSL